MINLSTSLSGSAAKRSVLSSVSSETALGLQMHDILRYREPQAQPIKALPKVAPSLAERIFDALVQAKVWTSRLAMHLPVTDRDRFYRQLDLLHDCDEWFGDESPVLLESYKSFIRFMLAYGGSSKPSLGLTPSGNLVAIWIADRDRLTVEFLSADRVDWVLSYHANEVAERVAGNTTSLRLMSNIQPYEPERWFS